MEEKEEKSLNRAELENLYLELEKPMYNVVYRWLWDREEALDVVQETFLRLWRMRHRIHRETIQPLAYRIAVNMASNRCRSKRFWKWVSLDSLPDRAMKTLPGDSQLASNLDVSKMRRIIEALPERLKKVIMLCDFSGLSYEEVGKVLGIPSGTVGSRRNKALKILKKNFETLIK